MAGFAIAKGKLGFPSGSSFAAFFILNRGGYFIA
jgi:hypothetical protein